jgi:hypothetical protein
MAKAIGEIAGVSPMKIDHVIRGAGGTVAGEAAKLPDTLFGGNGREAGNWTEAPFVRTLFTNPYRNAESIDRFYKVLEESNHDKAMYRARKIEINKNVRINEHLTGAANRLSKFRQLRAEVQQAPNMPPREKRERMDEIDRRMADIAQKALEDYDKYMGYGRAAGM